MADIQELKHKKTHGYKRAINVSLALKGEGQFINKIEAQVMKKKGDGTNEIVDAEEDYAKEPENDEEKYGWVVVESDNQVSTASDLYM